MSALKKARIQYQNEIYNVTVNDDLSVNLPNGEVKSEAEVTWLPPANGIMIALGLNYADHATELAFEPPKEPLIFVKSPGTYVGHNSHSWRPDNVDYMHYECELAVVIGKTAKNVKREDAWEYVDGFTLCNDYAIRDYLENYYRPNLRVKNRDGMTPVGPYILDKSAVKDPMNLGLKTWVNGELRQEGNTKDMIFDVPFLIEYLSEFMTLNPGDMIATGCPKGTSDVKAGDTVVIEVEGVGRLVNHVLTEAEFYQRQNA
ncbi:fumarylacetoacetate hydrolase family protein [Ignatzschineria sp. RMDPL8A]|uniref:fumarylacetoacetate hydrolase family protein n=1 Tax=Ignatzschineria sp. RMDPL8A TaxID=2999236 RepID=UPI002446681E|nr:fumarylacetoacetate hydrolase family protein [Ignatzschineria sp. RMDPL8A]MDG9730307.1 fumarylacetoacetate hydrolase family protein [Ignatzschineria sp. RMDPL8A]